MEKVEKNEQEKAPRQEVTVQVTKRHKIRTNVRAGSGHEVVTVK